MSILRATGTGAPLTGFSFAPGAFSGAAEVESFALPITWRTPFDVKMGLLVGAIPASAGTANVDFSQGATLNGIDLFANGVPVHDFSIVSESGTAYDANGVPEPGRGPMLAVGLLAIAAIRGRGMPALAEGRSCTGGAVRQSGRVESVPPPQVRRKRP